MSGVIPAATAALIERRTAIASLFERAAAVVEVSSESALAASHMRVQELIDRVAMDIEIADGLIIDSPDMLEEAQRIAGRLSSVASATGEIERERKALVAPLNAVVKVINDGYNTPREAIQARIVSLKDKMLGYQLEAQRRAREAEEAARREREEAARRAAAVEAEARARAEALAKEAQAAADAGAETLAHELAVEASVAIDSARQQAAATVQELRAVTSGPAAAVKGVRGKWRVAVTNPEATILHVAERIKAGDKSLVNLLTVDLKVADKLAAASEQHFNVPGLRADFEQSVAVRKVAV